MKNGQACYLEAIRQLAPALQERLLTVPPFYSESAREIRLLEGQRPLIVSSTPYQASGIVTREELEHSLVCLCGQSLHTHQRELTTGFIPLSGGHRAGVAGTAVYTQSGLSSLRDITAIVIRIAHDLEGIAEPVLSRVFKKGLCGVLIAGPPGSGKTTLLRDMAVTVSQKNIGVVVVDERGEIARGAHGCCVLKGYDKADGIMSAVRSLSPQIIFCDEIGSKQDVEAVEWALNCGVYIVTTIHARSKEELLHRKAGRQLLESGAFDQLVILGTQPVGCILEVCGTNGVG